MRQIKIGDKEYKIHYGQNAICALEDELDEGINEIFSRIEQGNVKLKDFRAFLWAGMLKENRNFTPEDVGEICDNANVKIADLLPECINEFNECFKRLIPEENSEEVEKNE